MTSDLLKYNESDLIFVDIETVSANRDIDPDSEEYRLFQWKLRDRDKWDALPTKQETLLAYRQTAALRAIYSKIVCISAGYIHDGKIVIRSYSGEEKDILRQFVDMVNSTQGKTLVLWNAKFDMPTIRKRFIINQMKDYLRDDVGNDSMKKPWTLKGILDLMEVWSGISYYSDGLDEVAYALKLPSPKADLKGSEVTEAYYNGELERVVKYCEGDVVTLANIWRYFTYRDIIHDVLVKTDQPSKTEVEELPLIIKIFNRGTILEEDNEALVKVSKGLKPAQRPLLVQLLQALQKGDIEEDLVQSIQKPPRKKRATKKSTKKKVENVKK